VYIQRKKTAGVKVLKITEKLIEDKVDKKNPLN
jgi:hypothetical protein